MGLELAPYVTTCMKLWVCYTENITTQYKKHKSNDWSRKLKVKEEKLSIMIQGVPRNITVGE